MLPFLRAGLVVTTIIGSYPRQAAKVYGLDLLSAAVGALATVPQPESTIYALLRSVMRKLKP